MTDDMAPLTVKRLHSILGKLIEQEKGDYEICVKERLYGDNSVYSVLYEYGVIEESEEDVGTFYFHKDLFDAHLLQKRLKRAIDMYEL